MPQYPSEKPNLWYRYIKIFINTDSHVIEIDYEELDIYFRVTRTSDMDGDKADIEVYDLSKDTRKMIDQMGTIYIIAGYSNGLREIIFKGSIMNVYSVEGGTDVCTYIKAIDNTRTAIDTYYRTKKYEKGTPFISIMYDTIDEWNTSIQEDDRYAPTYDIRQIFIGEFVDPNEYYGTDVFKLEKTETKTLTPYGVIWDIVDRTNGYIWADLKSTMLEKKDIKKEPGFLGIFEGKERVSWTFYLEEVSTGEVRAYYIPVRWEVGSPNELSSENGLIEIAPVDFIDRTQGWTGKCLLNPMIKRGGRVTCIPARKKGASSGGTESGKVVLEVKEVVHEHADGGVYYTTFKGTEVTGT